MNHIIIPIDSFEGIAILVTTVTILIVLIFILIDSFINKRAGDKLR